MEMTLETEINDAVALKWGRAELKATALEVQNRHLMREAAMRQQATAAPVPTPDGAAASPALGDPEQGSQHHEPA